MCKHDDWLKEYQPVNFVVVWRNICTEKMQCLQKYVVSKTGLNTRMETRLRSIGIYL